MSNSDDSSTSSSPPLPIPPLDSCGRIPLTGPPAPNYSPRVFPSSLPPAPPSLLSDMKALMTARSVPEDAQYSEGSTYFLPALLPPRTGLEALASQVFLLHAPAGSYDPARSGAEFWTQVIDTRDDIAPHWDRDYGLEDAGASVHPHVATVSYFSDVGGPTVVWEHYGGPGVGGGEFGGEVGAMHVSYPVKGKHLSFDGRFLHAAPNDLIVGDKEKKGTRRTFLVNVWINHVPVDSEVMGEELLGRMKCGAGEVAAADWSGEGEFGALEVGAGAGEDVTLPFVCDGRHGKVRVPRGEAVRLEGQRRMEGGEHALRVTWKGGGG